jgi:L-ribulose-5-phosphate 3-epimerase UlaE
MHKGKKALNNNCINRASKMQTLHDHSTNPELLLRDLVFFLNSIDFDEIFSLVVKIKGHGNYIIAWWLNN